MDYGTTRETPLGQSGVGTGCRRHGIESNTLAHLADSVDTCEVSLYSPPSLLPTHVAATPPSTLQTTCGLNRSLPEIHILGVPPPVHILST